MQKYGSNRRLTKHNHDKRYTCGLLKILCSGILLKKPDFDIGKKL